MSRLWMPLYVGDFLANTTHLNATETGIYIRLIMHCWENGHLPADPEKLRIISHASAKSWNKYCNILTFFERRESQHGPIYVHSRVSQERTKYEELSNKRKAAALQKHTQSQSQLPKEKKDPRKPADAGAVAPPVYTDSKHELWGEGVPILQALGVSNPRSIIGRWLKDTKDDAVTVLGAIQRARDVRVIDPVPWITRAIQTGPPRNGHAPRPGSREDRQEKTSNALTQLADYIAARADGGHGGGDAGATAVGQLRLVKPA